MTAELDEGPVGTTKPRNPLRDPQDRRLPRIAGPCGLVIFGVTGDLSRKKLLPAVYDLANRGLLPPGFALVGFAPAGRPPAPPARPAARPRAGGRRRAARRHGPPKHPPGLLKNPVRQHPRT